MLTCVSKCVGLDLNMLMPELFLKRLGLLHTYII